MNNESDRIGKEGMWARRGHLPGATEEKKGKTSVRIATVPAEIKTNT
jgi:hypothetical protein